MRRKDRTDEIKRAYFESNCVYQCCAHKSQCKITRATGIQQNSAQVLSKRTWSCLGSKDQLGITWQRPNAEKSWQLLRSVQWIRCVWCIWFPDEKIFIETPVNRKNSHVDGKVKNVEKCIISKTDSGGQSHSEQPYLILIASCMSRLCIVMILEDEDILFFCYPLYPVGQHFLTTGKILL